MRLATTSVFVFCFAKSFKWNVPDTHFQHTFRLFPSGETCRFLVVSGQYRFCVKYRYLDPSTGVRLKSPNFLLLAAHAHIYNICQAHNVTLPNFPNDFPPSHFSPFSTPTEQPHLHMVAHIAATVRRPHTMIEIFSPRVSTCQCTRAHLSEQYHIVPRRAPYTHTYRA